MKITRKTFGVLSSGKKVFLYTLQAGELRLSLSSLGATWTSLFVPSRRSGVADVLLGFDTLAGYALNPAAVGVTVGRFANRIGGAQFSLNGKQYPLFKNDGEHCLHGGRRGFSRLLWSSEEYKEKDGVFVRFELESPDGDEGFPANLHASVSYGLTKSNELVVDYKAKLDAPCPVNLTNHAYFNLAGEGSGDILSHEVQINASSYLEVDAELIPTGKLLSVEGGALDFRKRKVIKKDFDAVSGGYDHCFVVDGAAGKLRPCAEVFEARSGRTMKVFTTQPGVQFYSGNHIVELDGKAGSVYRIHDGLCLETQHFPDAPNQSAFPSALFGPERDYDEKALFAFNW
jgi:aldose 1-epimerase